MLKLAIRNLVRNLRRLRPMIIVLGLSFFLLFVANAVLEYVDSSFSDAYVRNLTGHAGISPASDENFTLFGADSLLVGEYLVPPLLDDYDGLAARVGEMSQVNDVTPVVTSAAQVEIGGRSGKRALFGVDFGDYHRFFPDLEIARGSLPGPGEPGILVQEAEFLAIERRFGADPIGLPALLTAAYESTFVIREAPLAGAFRYPVGDDVLERIVLVDADTARSLNGFVYGAADPVDLGETEQELLGSSMDDLFGMVGDDSGTTSETDDGGSVFDVLDDLFAEPADETAAAAPVSDAWNFLLVRFVEGVSLEAGIDEIASTLGEVNYVVRDWRRTMGGTVQIVWFLRIVLNAGIVFVIAGASAVTLNAIVLSVLERAKEIGTMRAIGATKARVGIMFSLEIALVISGTAVAGIVLGIAAVAAINAAGLVVDNRYLLQLFGGGTVRGTIDLPLVAGHLGAAFALAGVSLIYPLKKILGMTPVGAMR